MINNKKIRNCTVPFSPIHTLVNQHALGKILIKNIYQGWQGESITAIKEKHNDNPYSLRIGLPATDSQLKNDSIYFILHYLAYNPISKDIEMRELIPYRNMEKVYIGQSIDEKSYSDYKLFVDGTAVVNDLFLRNNEKTKDIPVSRLINNLIDRVEKLQQRIVDLEHQLQNKHIYK